jgi:hypothetical protein
LKAIFSKNVAPKKIKRSHERKLHMIHRPLSRRVALKGLGVSIALPFLETFAAPASLAAAEATASPFPRRMVFVYFPNGVWMDAWKSVGEGADFKLGPTLSAFEQFKSQMLVFSNLADKNAKGGGAHACTMPAYLSGESIYKTMGNDIRAARTCDQLVAQKIGNATRFPSLELGCDFGQQDGFCDTGFSCVYQTNISWRSATTPAPKEVNPRIVFDRLFAGRSPGETSITQQQREAMNLSILDFVREQARDLRRVVSAADSRRMDEFLTSIRDIERRIQAPPGELSKDAAGGMERPTRVPALFRDHFRLMADMLVLVLQTDMTRVATLVMATEGNRRSYPELGFTEEHHGVSHHGRKPELIEKFTKINEHHVGEMAYLIERLAKAPEGAGSLLDNSMVVYGSGMADGNRHAHADIPTVLFGKGGGGIAPGRHVICPEETPICNLWLSLMERMGVKEERFGDSTGPLTGLTA